MHLPPRGAGGGKKHYRGVMRDSPAFEKLYYLLGNPSAKGKRKRLAESREGGGGSGIHLLSGGDENACSFPLHLPSSRVTTSEGGKLLQRERKEEKKNFLSGACSQKKRGQSVFFSQVTSLRHWRGRGGEEERDTMIYRTETPKKEKRVIHILKKKRNARIVPESAKEPKAFL